MLPLRGDGSVVTGIRPASERRQVALPPSGTEIHTNQIFFQSTHIPNKSATSLVYRVSYEDSTVF